MRSIGTELVNIFMDSFVLPWLIQSEPLKER